MRLQPIAYNTTNKPLQPQHAARQGALVYPHPNPQNGALLQLGARDLNVLQTRVASEFPVFERFIRGGQMMLGYDSHPTVGAVNAQGDVVSLRVPVQKLNTEGSVYYDLISPYFPIDEEPRRLNSALQGYSPEMRQTFLKMDSILPHFWALVQDETEPVISEALKKLIQPYQKGCGPSIPKNVNALPSTFQI
jgi:hypothetical protein